MLSLFPFVRQSSRPVCLLQSEQSTEYFISFARASLARSSHFKNSCRNCCVLSAKMFELYFSPDARRTNVFTLKTFISVKKSLEQSENEFIL